VAHPQPSKFFAIKTQVLNDGGHSGYPSLDAAAIRFRTAVAHEDQADAQQYQAVRAAASQVLAACSRLGF
jgi:hypothetical protein